MERPKGIECLDWEPRVQGKKQCRFYVDGGDCEKPKPVCTEWARANPGKLSVLQQAKGDTTTLADSRAATAPQTAPEPRHAFGLPDAAAPPARPRNDVYDDPAPLTLSPTEAKRPGANGAAEPARMSAAEIARRQWTSITSPDGGLTKAMLDPPPYVPAQRITEAEVAALAAKADEVTLESAELGLVHLVKAPTGKSREGLELTYAEAATLRLIVDSFPGARVVAVRKTGKDGA